MVTWNFVNYLYTPESSSGIPGSTGSTVMQGSHKGDVVCPKALPAELMASYLQNRAPTYFDFGPLNL